jgi:hypothetical protein
VIGPFGSFFNDVLGVRIAYWVCVFLVCGLAFGLAFRLMVPRVRGTGVPAWAWVPAMALVLAVPLAGVTRLMASALWPAIRQSVGPIEWYGQTALVSLVYVSVYAWLRRAAAPTDQRVRDPVAETAEVRAEPGILRHLPPRLGQDLLCLSMEDHYVRLHTPHGSILVLMSLGQAISEVGEIEGLQIHRSWWVARRAVEVVVEDGRKLRIRLKGGIEAPVSRTNVARLRAAGWLEPLTTLTETSGLGASTS